MQAAIFRELRGSEIRGAIEVSVSSNGAPSLSVLKKSLIGLLHRRRTLAGTGSVKDCAGTRELVPCLFHLPTYDLPGLRHFSLSGLRTEEENASPSIFARFAGIIFPRRRGNVA